MVAGAFFKSFLFLRQTTPLTSSGKCKEQQPTHLGKEKTAMNVIRNKSPGDREIVDVLLAISHVFARLARQVLSLA